MQEATLISKAPLPVFCRGRGGAGLSLDGLGDVLDSRIAKQTYQTNASFSCSAEARKTVLLIPALLGPWSPGVSQVDPADLDPGASENSDGSLTLFFFF